jgi:hypothetical protein
VRKGWATVASDPCGGQRVKGRELERGGFIQQTTKPCINKTKIKRGMLQCTWRYGKATHGVGRGEASGGKARGRRRRVA